MLDIRRGLDGKLRGNPTIKVRLNGIQVFDRTLTDEEYLLVEAKEFFVLNPTDTVEVEVNGTVQHTYTVPANKRVLVRFEIKENPE